ncbi:MAG: DNA cytosine methyltransferase [Planctomycetes bacterium]|nr:DNA cytosine methyltransferase [Planctomycetota bacterium]
MLPQFALRGRRVDWLHGSPDCTHFSRAKGGKPREQHIRALAWVLYEWAKVARPRFLSLENVAEFTTWGPLDDAGQPIKERAGEDFRAFVAALRRLGYAVDWRVLCAADFGAPTIRRRLFMLARNDGQPIAWPEPTHGAGRPLPWRTAAECIDWSLPVPSIFGRKRPLAPATCRRIAAGVVRFVLQGQPFIVRYQGERRAGEDPRTESIHAPLPTATTEPRFALAAPTLVQTAHGDFGERAGVRAHSAVTPLGVVTGSNNHALVAAFLQQNFTGMVGKPLRVPVPTITARDHHSLVTASLGGDRAPQVAAFLTTYYGQGGTANRLDAPMPAVVTKARHGLVTVTIDGVDYAIADIGLRMLEPRELARAQGFPDSYVLEGSKAAQIARIGNSVVPQVAAAIVRANLGQEAAVA